MSENSSDGLGPSVVRRAKTISHQMHSQREGESRAAHVREQKNRGQE